VLTVRPMSALEALEAAQKLRKRFSADRPQGQHP
jgi:hypothetical protein